MLFLDSDSLVESSKFPLLPKVVHADMAAVLQSQKETMSVDQGVKFDWLGCLNEALLLFRWSRVELQLDPFW